MTQIIALIEKSHQKIVSFFNRYLDDNQLSGTIPTELGNLNGLAIL